ncbi:TDP-N-acetylfucosamine:lipid II N-acetylfucosaminyltransferase family protein [Marinobacter sp. F4206]|uniref:TDP-N-acetylfucosamine:lipid II N-acetylfucosaminyltransferase n=1 Tax=Marinobacter sp. F4206 TaxID=2861777 RepID=UPI001C5D99AC|nr:TDP-N-acetylfucosamine:lipid II N-acetylfucosaminyltransferase [Marinobacter sp. F4206]MBW4933798.1 TDP-N-acetylfucosamine:lipid II N-acetylfucosaminyltransferase [Marinobacter sp. F4206]
MRLLHLIKDEKFPDSAYEFFESVAPGQNTFMLAGTSEPIVYLQKIDPVRVPKYAFRSSKFIKSLDQYDAIILHSLYAFSLEVLARLNRRVPVVWIGLGYDYYDLLMSSPLELLKPETRAVQSPKTSKLWKAPALRINEMLGRALYPNASRKRKLVQKIDLFAPVLQSEYVLLKQALGEKPFPEYVRWNYGKIADLVDGRLGPEFVTGKNILVGNSADPSNNQIDVFRILAETGIPAGSTVIVPLSYGDADYRKKVIKEGKRLLGDQFRPVTEFMAFDEYIELVSTCSSVIMNHIRQQAAGNVFIMLYLGAKVYLDASNPLYKEFENMGLKISSVDALSEDCETLDQPLKPALVSKQQEIIRATRGRSAFEAYTEDLIAEVARVKKEKNP